MKIRPNSFHVIIAAALVGLLANGPCFAQEVQPITKEDLRTGFKAGLEKVKSNYVDCLAKLKLTPDDVEALEEEGEISDPDILVCIDTKKTERAALIEEYKALRASFREQEKAGREQEKAVREQERAVREQERAARKDTQAEKRTSTHPKGGGKKA